jgi:hypothetical protein
MLTTVVVLLGDVSDRMRWHFVETRWLLRAAWCCLYFDDLHSLNQCQEQTFLFLVAKKVAVIRDNFRL